MKKKTFLIISILTFSLVANAQWRIGVIGGADYNIYTIDKHYMVDWHYQGAWGGTFGIMGQYDFNDWFGVRAEVDYTMKNHREYRTGLLANTDYVVDNHYVQLPLMANFRFGGEKLKGFLNLGVYGGYWAVKWLNGSINSVDLNITESFSWLNEKFDSEKDQRIDVGFAGGVGIEFRLNKLFSGQLEGRTYYSTRSIQKDYMKIKDPKYNTTFALLAGVCYHF